ncbi:MFS transporter [Actinomycetota bacterium]|nr:MFS transporter [Actinomycetota bacterium]
MKIKFGFIMFLGAIGGLLFGFDTGIISGASPLIQKELGLDELALGFITSAVLIGSAIGALSIGTLSDKFGRKKLLIFAAILFTIGAALCAVSGNFAFLTVSRIILGLGVGAASSLVPAYLAELAPAAKRGSFGTLFQLLITAGILLAYVSNLGFLNHNIAGITDWRWMLGSAVIPALIMLIGSFLLPESPRFLAAQGDDAQAKAVLDHLREGTGEDADKELAEIKEAAAQPKGGVADLFKVAGPATIVAIGIMFLQQLVGINSVIYFIPNVFTKAFHFTEADAIWVSVGIGIVNFVVTIIAVFVMDRFNRKSLLYFGSVVMAVSLFVLVAINLLTDVSDAGVPTIIFIAVYIFGFAISWGPIAWVLIGEIFPLSVRGAGNSIGSGANWIGNWIVSTFFLVLLSQSGNVFPQAGVDGGNVVLPFIIFGVFAIISIFFVKFLVPETKGKSLEEIESELRAK